MKQGDVASKSTAGHSRSQLRKCVYLRESENPPPRLQDSKEESDLFSLSVFLWFSFTRGFLQQVFLEGFCNGAAAGMHLQFRVNPPHVHINGVKAEEEFVGNNFL